jgi:alkyl hydroperoxide reductase subunit AhpC
VPFPLVSDQPLASFRAYGAVDPRTGAAWHGAFLIDAHGRLIWRVVGAEPFMALPELLAEAQRVLPLRAEPSSPATNSKTASTP